jgi:hypothetical protein
MKTGMMNIHVFHGEQVVMGQGIIRGHIGRGAVDPGGL